MTCAKVAAEDEAKKEKEKEEEAKRVAELKQLKIRKTAEKLSKIAANIILSTFVVGVGCLAAFGFVQLLKFVAK